MRIMAANNDDRFQEWVAAGPPSTAPQQPDRSRAGNAESARRSLPGAAIPGVSLNGTLERIGCGYLVLDRARNVLHASDMARKLLQNETGLKDSSTEGLSWAVRRLIDRAAPGAQTGALCCVQVEREDGHPLVFDQIHEDVDQGRVVVVVLDLNAQPQPNPLTLQRMFKLTAAETLLALRMARGASPGDVARERRLSRTTVRSQLASVFAKTQTRRQPELVALLSRVAVLS